MKAKYVYFTIALILLTKQSVWSKNKQEVDKPNFITTLDFSYLVGAQIYNDNFLYNPGFGFNFAHNYSVTDDFHVGLGAGYSSLLDEDFIPVYVDFFALRSKKKNAPFMQFQVGYAFAGDKHTNNLDQYDMKGGICFTAGVGRSWKINKHYAFLASLKYMHQFAELSYDIYDGSNYTEPVDFMTFKISLGLLLN